MENLDQYFPKVRKDQMIAAALAFNPRELRADSLTPAAASFLENIDPVLAFHVQMGSPRALTRKDAGELLFFARQLEYIRPGLLEVLFPALEAKNYIPLETSIPSGAEQFTYRVMKKIGRAQIIKDYSTDPPRTDVVGGETVQKLHSIADMYGYTMQELRAAMMAQLPLDVRKAMSARYAIALLVDEVLFYGHADVIAEQSATGLDAGALNTGMVGIANLANTTSFTTPTGSQGSKLWRKKSPDEMVADLHQFVNNIVASTFGIHRPDSMVMGLRAYNKASTTRMGDGSNQTVLDFFLKTSPYVKNVDMSYRLDAASSPNWNGTSSATTGRIIAYEKNPERLVGLMPIEFEQMPPQTEHFETRTACHARVGGVAGLYPASISNMDDCTDTTD